MSIKIALFDTKPYDREMFDELNKNYGFEIKYFKFNLTFENAVLAEGSDAVCVFVNDLVTAEIIDRMHGYGIRLIALRCAGYNNVDFKAAYGKIHVVRVPAYSPNAIAEHTVALILSLNRKIHRAYWRTRDSNFSLNGLMGFDLYKKYAGVIGTGKIGKALVRILRGFGMEVLAHDPFPDDEFSRETGCRYVSLDDIFAGSDIISLNCPLTRETEFMINNDTIARMKENVMIVNTGRGKLIKTADLIGGLKSGKIASAGLDVYEEEAEYFFEDLSNRVLTDDILARLLTFNNVIITSHQGFFTREAMHNISETTLDNIKNFFEGKTQETELCYRCLKDSRECLKNEGKQCF
jgi:D-lactate dehydrogenase